jgi:CheY-like chemotaxis protein
MRAERKTVTLLIVEDDPHLRELLHAAGERSGRFASIALASDGQAAWDQIQAGLVRHPPQLPDFILSDLSMPRRDGIQLIRDLKGHPATRHIPIAVMTSSDRPNDRENATAAGCCAFFNKPVRLEEFTTLIGSVPDICGDCAVVSGRKSP